MIKYYSIIPATAFADLQRTYGIITQLADAEGTPNGWVLLEGHHTPGRLAEITTLGGQNFTYEEFTEWQAALQN